MREVTYIDENVGQIQILPIENLDYCTREMDKLRKFSEEHLAPNGIGWTELYYSEEEAPAPLSSISLDLNLVLASLSSHLKAFDSIRVFAFDCGFASPCNKNIHAYGFDSDCAIFISQSETSKVSEIWFELAGPETEKQTALMLALKSLSNFGSFLYVDWGWKCFFKLNDEDGLATYLKQREERFSQPVKLNFPTKKIEPLEKEISEKTKKPWWEFLN